MAKAVVESVVGIIVDGEQAVFYPEGIAKVFVECVAGDFGLPATQVFPIEEGYPFRLLLARAET